MSRRMFSFMALERSSSNSLVALSLVCSFSSASLFLLNYSNRWYSSMMSFFCSTRDFFSEDNPFYF